MLTRDGVDETTNPAYFVSPAESDAGGGHGMIFDLGSSDGALSAGELSHTWSITIKVGFDPREVDAYADNLIVTRTDNGDGTWDVTYTGDPVEMGDNSECTTNAWPWSCPYTAKANTVNFLGEANDYQNWADASQWGDFDGMTMSTNIEATGLPPQIDPTTFAMTIQLANSHFLAGSSTPFEGFFYLSIPNGYLEAMGIDDPSTITPSGVDAGGAGGAMITVTPGATATQVSIAGMTFSPHKLKIRRGVITPTVPSKLRAHRSSATRATLTFKRAKPRGSRITSYLARCTAKHYAAVRAKGKHLRLHLHGFSPGTAYRCQVRAKAKAGYGHWSAKKKLRP